MPTLEAQKPPLPAPQVREVRSFDGTPLAVNTWGEPRRLAVVLVHGLGLSCRSWGEVPGRLAKYHYVVGYDLRGHGRSGASPDKDYSLSAHAADLGVVLEHAVEPDGAALMVAHSMGGGILLAHAWHSGLGPIRGAVFAGSSGSRVTVPGLPFGKGPERIDAWLRAGWLNVLRGFTHAGRYLRPIEPISDRVVRRMVFRDGASEELVKQVRDDFLKTEPEVLAHTALASLSHNGAEYAPALGVPTLVVHGAKDPESSDDDIEALMTALPDAARVELPEAGHMLPLTNADDVVEHVQRWAQRVAE